MKKLFAKLVILSVFSLAVAPGLAQAVTNVSFQQLPIVSVWSKFGGALQSGGSCKISGTITNCCNGVGLVGGTCPGFFSNTDPNLDFAKDGNANSLWCSSAAWGQNAQYADDFIYVDLGEVKNINQVVIDQPSGAPFACTRATDYKIQIQNQVTGMWDSVKEEVGSTSTTKSFVSLSPVRGRYVRLYTNKVGTAPMQRLAVKEFKVYGSNLPVYLNTINNTVSPSVPTGAAIPLVGRNFTATNNTIIVGSSTIGVYNSAGGQINLTLPNYILPGRHAVRVINSSGESNVINLLVTPPPNYMSFYARIIDTNTVVSGSSKNVSDAEIKITQPDVSAQHGNTFTMTWATPSGYECKLRKSKHQGGVNIGPMISHEESPVGSSGTFTHTFESEPANYYYYAQVNCVPSQSLRNQGVSFGLGRSVLVSVYPPPSCELNFSTIDARLNYYLGVNITEESFRGWAEDDPNDPSGDKEDIFDAMGLNQSACLTRGSGFVPSIVDRAIGSGSNRGVGYFELVGAKRYTDEGNPLSLRMAYLHSNGDIIGHAVIALRITQSGDNFTVSYLDPNGPSTGTVQCGPVDNSFNEYVGATMISCGDFDSVGIEESIPQGFVPPTDLIGARRNWCLGHPDDEVCDRDVASWLESNYPDIDNDPYEPLGYPGVCAGWSDFVLRVAYLGNFVGECPAPGSKVGATSTPPAPTPSPTPSLINLVTNVGLEGSSIDWFNNASWKANLTLDRVEKYAGSQSLKHKLTNWEWASAGKQITSLKPNTSYKAEVMLKYQISDPAKYNIGKTGLFIESAGSTPGERNLCKDNFTTSDNGGWVKYTCTFNSGSHSQVNIVVGQTLTDSRCRNSYTGADGRNCYDAQVNIDEVKLYENLSAWRRLIQPLAVNWHKVLAAVVNFWK